MLNFSSPQDWISVKCPVCLNILGSKKKDEIKSFVCKTEGCSDTEHVFYPGQTKRPGKSTPQISYLHKKKNCGCLNCESK